MTNNQIIEFEDKITALSAAIKLFTEELPEKADKQNRDFLGTLWLNNRNLIRQAQELDKELVECGDFR